MVQKTITYSCLMYIARFGVRNLKGVVAAMHIGIPFQIFMERKDMLHEKSLEFLDVSFVAPTFQEFLPCFEQVFNGDDILIGMREGDAGHYAKRTPPPTILPVLERAKAAYILWSDYRLTIPNTKRYSLGERIDVLFIEIIESMAAASFLPRGDKEPYLRLAIRKLDTLRILLMVAWESRALDTKKYGALSEHIETMGRMLGGWYGQVVKQNSPSLKLGEK